MLAHMFKMLSEGMTESNVIVKLGTNGRTLSSSPYLIYTVTGADPGFFLGGGAPLTDR